jgi:hypothetical protein
LRLVGRLFDLFLEAVVIEAECHSGATEAMRLDKSDGQGPEGLRNAAAPLPGGSPSLKLTPPLCQILG